MKNKRLAAAVLGVSLLWGTAAYGSYSLAEYKKEHSKEIDVLAKEEQLDFLVHNGMSEEEFLESIRFDLDELTRSKNVLAIKVPILTRFGGHHDHKAIKDSLELVDHLNEVSLGILKKPTHDEKYELTALLVFSTKELTDIKRILLENNISKEKENLEFLMESYSSKIDTINEYFNANMEVIKNGQQNDGENI